jgi:hypothetical protein
VETTSFNQHKPSSTNELAVGVDLAVIATQPPGYSSYLNSTVPDAQFYAVRTAYPNQKTVDNTKLLRQLSTDQLHQKMVEAQYR